MEGLVDITIGEEVFRLNAGKIIVMLANIPHKLSAIKDTEMLLLRMKYTH